MSAKATGGATGSLQIGIFADNLRLPLREGVSKAAELGVQSFQMFTTSGAVLPENMSGPQRAEFRRFYEGLGLKLSATCADFGHGFVDAGKNRELIPRLYADVLQDALRQIGAYAEQHGVVLATETGPESGPVLRALLDRVDNRGVRVNLDPANLTMAGYDLDEALDALLPYIVHTHAKDGYRGSRPRATAAPSRLSGRLGPIPSPTSAKRSPSCGSSDGRCRERRSASLKPAVDGGTSTRTGKVRRGTAGPRRRTPRGRGGFVPG